jgi:peptidoglycan/xylan/chitin deacetylase (PgdA/CDA1 family)
MSEPIKENLVSTLSPGELYKGPWPNNATAAVAISFDVDHETPWTRDNDYSVTNLSAGAYGSYSALPRILETLSELQIRSTFFVPGVISLLHSGDIEKIHAEGHEIGLHSWEHERFDLLSRDEELESNTKSIEVIKKITGVSPQGLRCPSFAMSRNTINIMKELELLYDSTLMHHDEPYEIIQEGNETGIIEIPVSWVRDDAAFFVIDRFTSLRPIPNAKDIIDTWNCEYEMAKKEGGLFNLTLHPDLIGQRSRWKPFTDFLSKIREDQDVWVGTHLEIAQLVKAGLNAQ